MLETISSVKLARKLGQTATAMHRPEPLKVLIQVNTSDEESMFICRDTNLYVL
jgi:uncharacterized pyridoxal phosphate-containing UPF0001 family protein